VEGRVKLGLRRRAEGRHGR